MYKFNFEFNGFPELRNQSLYPARRASLWLSKIARLWLPRFRLLFHPTSCIHAVVRRSTDSILGVVLAILSLHCIRATISDTLL